MGKDIENTVSTYRIAVTCALEGLKYGVVNGGLSESECMFIGRSVCTILERCDLCGTSQPTVQDVTQ